jgi:hypothetical protein
VADCVEIGENRGKERLVRVRTGRVIGLGEVVRNGIVVILVLFLKDVRRGEWVLQGEVLFAGFKGSLSTRRRRVHKRGGLEVGCKLIVNYLIKFYPWNDLKNNKNYIICIYI